MARASSFLRPVDGRATEINPPAYKRRFPSFCWTPAAKVAEVSHRALGRKRVVFLPGFNTHVTLFFWKLKLGHYYFGVLRRWDRLMRMLKLQPPLPDLPADEATRDTERED